MENRELTDLEKSKVEVLVTAYRKGVERFISKLDQPVAEYEVVRSETYLGVVRKQFLDPSYKVLNLEGDGQIISE